MSKRSTIVGFAAIILLMTAAGAQGLAGENTVDSGDIIDGSVKHADIKPNTIGSSRMLDNSVHSVKISDNSVVNADIASNASIALSKTNLIKDTISVNPPNLVTGGCFTQTIYSGTFTFRGDDVVTVTPDTSSWPNQLLVRTENDTSAAPAPFGSSSVTLVVCNVGAAVDAPATTFDYAAIP